jgi:hypothetical protein
VSQLENVTQVIQTLCLCKLDEERTDCCRSGGRVPIVAAPFARLIVNILIFACQHGTRRAITACDITHVIASVPLLRKTLRCSDLCRGRWSQGERASRNPDPTRAHMFVSRTPGARFDHARKRRDSRVCLGTEACTESHHGEPQLCDLQFKIRLTHTHKHNARLSKFPPDINSRQLSVY